MKKTRKISVTSTARVDVPADRLWSVLADEFESISHWASTIPVSGHNDVAAAVVDGAPSVGRSCTIPGFGVTDERFTHFDAARRTFTYSVAATKMPSFVTSVENTWTVRDLGGGRSEATSVATAHVAGLVGALAAPMMRLQLARTLRPTLEDLKVYAETGRVSARKARQTQRARARAA
ncbi:SRPBCC family protein [Kineosporia sp. R_H_3]|uniref:SRPBCC family protein n=1 Tax=Kineosporia sp. R_H_3 TaxID=1961848 RepID=UPI000B4BBB59|nr:SRPBCC family protein [Kineosporia sp. R_H_3]